MVCERMVRPCLYIQQSCWFQEKHRATNTEVQRDIDSFVRGAFEERDQNVLSVCDCRRMGLLDRRIWLNRFPKMPDSQHLHAECHPSGDDRAVRSRANSIHRYVGFTDDSRLTCRPLIRLHASEFDHLGPLFGLLGNELGEVGT